MTIQSAGPETVSIVERMPQQALILDIEGPVSEMPRMMGDAFARTIAAIERGGGSVSGPPFARYGGFGRTITAEVGFPFVGALTPEAPLRVIELPGGRVVTTTHVGPYDEIAGAWQRGGRWLAEHGLVQAGPPWETYLTGPQEPGPPVTEICWPVR